MENEFERTGWMVYKLNALNQMNQGEFTEAIGSIYENSPWITEQAWYKRPFSTVQELDRLMENIVNEATVTEKLELIKAHPDLGASVEMTSDSVKEQKGAGLDQLTKAEKEELLTLNQTYIEKFSFPFIMAVRGQDKRKITEGLKKRVKEDYETELGTALKEIFKIASFRLDDLVE